MQSLDGNQLWCPGPSLWNLIAEHVHGSELPKVRTALGQALIDMYTEVHAEAEMCLKMWQKSQRGGTHGSMAGATLPCQQAPPLPDPPALKELVRAEVKMLLQTLSERASSGGRDSEKLLLRYNPQTVNYALGHLDSCSTICTNPGETDNGGKTGNRTRLSSRCSVQSNAEDEIEAVRDELNATDIDQVADRLKSVMLEECEALKTLVQHLKESINRTHRRENEFDKPEPTLSELRELRGAVQMDLELYPVSLAASSTTSSPHPVKKLKNRFRLLPGQMASDETLTAASVLKPHPPPLRHTNPRPPAGPPLTRTIQTSSLSVTHGQRRSVSVISKSNKAPLCNKISTSEQENRYFTTDQIEDESEHCRLSLEEDGASLHRRSPASSPRFQIKPQRNSPAHEAHLSSLRSFQSDSRDVRKRVVSLSSHSVTPNRQQKSGSGLVPTTAQTDNDRIEISPESFYSLVLSETPSQNYSWKSSAGVDCGHLGKDVDQHQSPTDCFSRSQSGGEQRQNNCSRPVSEQINGHFSTSSLRPVRDIAAQPQSVQEAQTGLEIISTFYQPVPPTRVST